MTGFDEGGGEGPEAREDEERAASLGAEFELVALGVEDEQHDTGEGEEGDAHPRFFEEERAEGARGRQGWWRVDVEGGGEGAGLLGEVLGELLGKYGHADLYARGLEWLWAGYDEVWAEAKNTVFWLIVARGRAGRR